MNVTTNLLPSEYLTLYFLNGSTYFLLRKFLYLDLLECLNWFVTFWIRSGTSQLIYGFWISLRVFGTTHVLPFEYLNLAFYECLSSFIIFMHVKSALHVKNTISLKCQVMSIQCQLSCQVSFTCKKTLVWLMTVQLSSQFHLSRPPYVN